MQIDKTRAAEELEYEETTATDEKAPFKLTIAERVELKFKQHCVALPKEIVSWAEDK